MKRSNRVLHRRRRRRGWVIVDIITGLIILMVLLVTLSAAMARQRRGEQKLADTRAAMRLAEQTATALQLAQPPPAPAEGETIEILPIQPADGIAGKSWVRIRVTQKGRTATLVALAPTPSAAPSTGGAK